MEKDYIGSRDDRPEDRSISSRAHMRDELSNQIEAFLSSGGRISEVPPEVPPNVMADPPRKPTSNYGSRPI